MTKANTTAGGPMSTESQICFRRVAMSRRELYNTKLNHVNPISLYGTLLTSTDGMSLTRALAVALVASATFSPSQQTPPSTPPHPADMTVPSDDCTVWYVGDYMRKGATTYSSRIGAFRMPGCEARTR